jgi:signal transduction histidine kinase/FixJ family two-component response regulator
MSPQGDAAETSARWMQALERLAGAAVADKERSLLLPELLAVFADAVDADRAALRLQSHGEFSLEAALGSRDEDGASWLPIAADALQQLASGEPVSTSVIHHIPLMMEREVAGVRDLLGVVSLESRGREFWPPEEERLLTRLAGLTAALLDRRRAFDALELAVQSRDQVLAVVAHDLRNPISVIQLAANSLLKRAPDSLARRPIERILRGAQRADRLIGDLLQIDAIQGGRFAIEKTRIDATDVIFAALESQQNLAAKASVIIATDLSPALPPIEGDEGRLLEVLENLIDNAVKFTRPGGSVTVGATGRERDLLVWVKDSGSGVSPEHLPHLFDRFWQAQKTDRRGTGLGLTICKAIVEAHGGRIWAESTAGVGTTLYFSLPSASAEDQPEPSAITSILLVDDRPENLLSLEAILERPDYRLVSVRSGAEALGVALRERFSVALIDIAMPGMTGLEVAHHLKGLERSREIPIIFITAFGDDPQEIHRAYSAGGADYLVKPLDPEIVRKKVAVFVDLSRKRQTGPDPRQAAAYPASAGQTSES